MNVDLTIRNSFSLARLGEPIKLQSKKAQALLIYLALNDKPQSREHLATLFWGDRFDDQARRSLRQALFALRKAVGPDIVVGDNRLSVQGLNVKNGLTTQFLNSFPAISDQFDAWLHSEYEKNSATVRQSLIGSSDQEFSEGRFANALSFAEKLLDIDPLNEEAQCIAMRALSRLNRRTDALMRYEKFVTLLRTELDADPSAEIISLAEELRSRTQPLGRTNFSSATPHLVFMPFEDLGGGETASFFAQELPSAVSNMAALTEWVTVVPAVAVLEKFPEHTNPLQVARAFSGEMVVTGSAKQMGKKIRVSMQALDVKSAKPLWAHVEVIDEENAFDAFEILAPLAFNGAWQAMRSIAFQFDVLEQLEQQLETPSAFMATMQRLFTATYSQEHSRGSLGHWLAATDYAVECFPENTILLGFSALAIFGQAHLSDGKDRVERYKLSQEVANRAIALGSGGPSSYAAAMQETIWLGEHDKADDLFRALPLGSVTAAYKGIYATSLAFRGRCDEASAYLKQVIVDESGSALVFYRNTSLAVAHFAVGRYDEAIKFAGKAVDGNAEYFMGHLVLIASLELAGDHKAATEAVGVMKNNYRDPTVSEFEFVPFTDPQTKSLFLDALRGAGLPE